MATNRDTRGIVTGEPRCPESGHVRFGSGAAGKGPAYAGTSPTAYRHPVGSRGGTGVLEGQLLSAVPGLDLAERARVGQAAARQSRDRGCRAGYRVRLVRGPRAAA